MNFCPQCGSARLGNFCGTCGFAFQKSAETSPSVPQGVWLIDPSDPNRERFWTGSSWTQETRPLGSPSVQVSSKKALLKKLVYGKNFDETKHCANCGKPFGRSKTCSNCAD